MVQHKPHPNTVLSLWLHVSNFLSDKQTLCELCEHINNVRKWELTMTTTFGFF